MAKNPITKTANKITQRTGTYSGKGMLTAELICCFVIVFIRIVADFSVDETTGAVTSNVLHNADTYGPFPIALGLIGVFFILSFLAASGGTKSKLAVIFGGVITLALGLKSIPEIEKIATELGDIGSITVPTATGVESSDLSGASNPNTDIQNYLGSVGTSDSGSTGTGTSTVQGVQGTAPGVSATGATPPGAVTNPTSIFPTINPGGSVTPAPVIRGGPPES